MTLHRGELLVWARLERDRLEQARRLATVERECLRRVNPRLEADTKTERALVDIQRRITQLTVLIETGRLRTSR